MEQGIDYRTGGKLTHCGCEIFEKTGGKDIECIVIERIEYHPEGVSIGGRRESNVWEAHFAPNPYTKLPMVLNSTNRKRIAKLFGTRYINLLKNIAVRLTHEKCRDVQDGGETEGLRISLIRATQPKVQQKPELTPKSSKWQGAINWLKDGHLIEELKQHYVISEDTEKAIADELNAESV